MQYRPAIRVTTRLILTTATLAALLTCAAIVACWIRGFARVDTIYWQLDDHRAVAVSSAFNAFIYQYTTGVAFGPEGVSYESYNYPRDGFGEDVMKVVRTRPPTVLMNPARFELLGTSYWAGPTRDGGTDASDWHHELIIPKWQLLLVAALLPVRTLWLFLRRRLLRRRRIQSGLCLRCGYDLRAATGRCPECGTITSSQIAYFAPVPPTDTRTPK